MEGDKLVEERKEKITKFFKAKYSWIVYLFLAIVIFISSWIRTRNLYGLRDITTGGWTLGPDLDPFLFLRWAKYIVTNGSLAAIDTLRHAPIGWPTNTQFLLHPYLIAWFHKIAVLFGSVSVEQSAVIYPVVMFGLGIIFFFLLVRKIFIDEAGEGWADAIAILAALFLAIIPSLITRTIAGIPDKQGSSGVFIYASLYFFLSCWKSKKLFAQLTFALLAGLFTGFIGIFWGGYFIVFLIIEATATFAFLFGKFNKNKFYQYLLWVIPPLIIMHFTMPVVFSIHALLSSFYTAYALGFIIILAFDLFIYEKYLKEKITIGKKIPHKIKSLILSIILLFIIGTILINPKLVFTTIKELVVKLINPAPKDRVNITVAENRVPYLSEIAGSFGPYFKGIPIFFILFLLGSVYLLNRMLSKFERKERIIMVSSYAYLLFATLFSRYSATSLFNGNNATSYLFYGSGILLFAGSLIYYYLKYNSEGKGDIISALDIGFVMTMVLFFFSLISVKGAVRLILILVPPAAILGAYAIVVPIKLWFTNKNNNKISMWYAALAILVLICAATSAYEFYQNSNNIAHSYIPTSYTQQWQKAMSWVRTSTPVNAVFAHWWDYGYWVQYEGQRATVVDGGNDIPYWDYLMGRYGLTNTNSSDSLPFFYAHNVTNLLIDSSDIGKYSAFSTIGSDISYDRASYIAPFLKDNTQTQETKNSTAFVYYGGFQLDEDLNYNNNGTQAFLPGGKAGVGAIVTQKDASGKLLQPNAIFIYQNIQYRIPLRYAYYNGSLIDFNSGIDAGVFIFPYISQASNGGIAIDPDGAMLYLSRRTFHSTVGRLYLMNQNDNFFKLVHSEDDLIVSQLKAGNYISSNTDFVYYGDVRGPLRIWQVNYPQGMQVDPVYNLLDYPDQRLTVSK